MTKKFCLKFCTRIAFLSVFFVLPNLASATYAPGETLNPSCGPNDAGCDVSSILDVPYGGTNITTYNPGDILYAVSSTSLETLSVAADGRVLKLAGGLPYWGNDLGGTTFLASEQGIHLDTASNTFMLVLDGSSLSQSVLGARISPTYPGQSSIATVGTITTGTWQGDPIAPSEGGTGFSSFTPGDTFYGSNTTTVSKLPIGAEGSVFKVSAGLPEWGTDNVGPTYLASELGLHLATSTNTFALALDGATLSDSTSGLRISANYPGQSTINTVGTITSGTWNGDTIAPTNGGTGNTLYARGDILYASGTSTLTKLPIAADNSILRVTSGVPSWGVENAGASYLASEQGLHLSTSTNTFLIDLDGATLTQSGSGLRLASTYPGQSSINTLGTISAGHWSGDPIDINSGGTGITTAPTDGQLLIGNGSNYSLGNITGTGGVTVANGTGTVNISLSVATIPTVTAPVANDYLPIYASGTLLRNKISFEDLFAGVLGSLNYQGVWDAAINVPLLTNGDCSTTTKGRYYVVTNAGTTTLGTESTWLNGDWAVCNGTIWERNKNSVNIASVFGRTGTITAQAGDYNGLQILNTPSGSITANTVQGALNELGLEKETYIATGTSAQYFRGDKTWQTLDTAAVAENPTALYYTDAHARNAITSSALGLSYDNLSGVLSLTGGYNIPTTASTSNWNTAYSWGNHASAGYLTGLSGDGTTAGSGIAGLTLKTVNSNVGTFGSPTSAVSFTVNDKGLITAASSSAMILNESDIIGLTTDLSGKLSNVLPANQIFVGNVSGVATAVNPTLAAAPGTFHISTAGVFTLPDANTATRGLLTSTDWNIFNGKQAPLGYTAENTSNKTLDLNADGASDTKYPSARAVKTYTDSLALGINWQQPVELINVVGETSTPISSPANYDAYIISPGGNWTSVNPSFLPGDLVQYQPPSWVKIKSLVTGDRFGIGFKSTTTPSGPFSGKLNNRVTFDSTINGSNYTYTFAPPVNNEAVFVQNANAYYKDISFVYSSNLAQWVQLSASASYTFNNGLHASGNTISLGNLTTDWNQTNNFAITTAGNINLNSGNLITSTSTASLFNTNATTLNIGGAASLINLGAAGATVTGGGALTIISGSSTNLAIDTGGAGTLNLGTGNDAKIINLGTGTGGNNIRIGTDVGGIDTIRIGSPLDALSITSAAFNVSTLGALSGITTLNDITVASTSLTFPGSGSITSSGINPLTLDSGTTGSLNLGTGNHSKTIRIGTGNAGNTIDIGTDNTLADTITIGSPLDALSLTSSGLNVSTIGALTGVSAIDSVLFSSSTMQFAATGTITSTNGHALTIDSGTNGMVNIGTGNNAKTINVGTGNAGDIINIGINNTIADTITIGSALDVFALSSTGLNVSSSGALSGVSSLDGIAVSPTGLSFAATGTIMSADGNALILDSSSTGAIDIGTNAHAKTITLGNGTGTTTLALLAGTGNIDIGANAVARTINIGTAAAAAQNINIGGTGANIIGIGDTQTSGTLSLGSAMTDGSINIGGIGAQTGNIAIGAGTGAQTITLGGGATGTKTINIGISSAPNTINIGTDNTTPDAITIGTALDALAISSAGLNVATNGALTGVPSLDTISVGTSSLAFLGLGTITSGAATPLSIDSGTTGALNVGTSANAKAITIGNGSGATSINILSGTGNIDIGANAVARTINIGTAAAAAQNINIGGTGANILAMGNVQTGGSILIGNNMTTGNISIGGTGAQTGNIDIGVGTGAQVLTLGGGSTGGKTVNIGIGTASNTINIGTDNTTPDTITIGSASDVLAIASAGLNVSTLGALSGVQSLDGILVGTSSLAFAGVGTITSSSSNALTLDTGMTGTLNLGTGNNAKIINLGTGNAGDIINIGTDNTIADTITIGSALDAFALTSTGLNVSTSGALTGVSSIDGLTIGSTAISFSGTGTVASTGVNPITLDSGTTGSVNIGTGNDGKAINIGTGTGGNTISIGTSNTLLDTISIGSALDAFALTSSGLNVTTGGALSGVTSIDSVLHSSSAITFAATGSITTSGANALTIDSGSSGTLNLGTGNTSKILNIGTGNSGDIINIGTNNSVADAITIGSALDTLSLSSNGLNVSSAGAVTGVATIDTIAFSPTAMTFAATGTITSGDANALSIDSATNGAVNLGAGAFAKQITIGNGTGATALTLNAGTGNINIGTNAIARTINVGTAIGVAQIINIGGTGANTIGIGNTQNAGTIAIGNAMTTGSITIGGTGAQTGAINIGIGTGAQAINLGTGGTGAKTINIGTGAVAQTVSVGNNTTGTQLNLSAGSLGIVLAGVLPQANNNLVLCINATNNKLYYGSSNTACQGSSRTVKHDIEDIALGLDAIHALRPVSYAYNTDNEKALGFIAEEAVNVDERLIVRDAAGNPSAINPDYFIPILTKGIQQLDDKFNHFIEQGGISLDALNQLALSGGLHVEGEVDLGKDTVGEAVVNTGAHAVRITFSSPFNATPIVTITKLTEGVLSDYYVDEISNTGFTIKISPAKEKAMRFSWHAFGAPDGIRTFSDGATTSVATLMVTDTAVTTSNTNVEIVAQSNTPQNESTSQTSINTTSTPATSTSSTIAATTTDAEPSTGATTESATSSDASISIYPTTTTTVEATIMPPPPPPETTTTETVAPPAPVVSEVATTPTNTTTVQSAPTDATTTP